MTAESTVTAGSPFEASVRAVDPFGQTAVGYTGTATFTSADPYGATLPADHTFTAADAGVYPFPGAREKLAPFRVNCRVETFREILLAPRKVYEISTGQLTRGSKNSEKTSK